MIKDIVVNLSVNTEGGPAGAYAVSVAAALDAHLAAIAFLYDPILPISGTGYIPAEVIETQQADNEAAAKAALDRFTEAARRAGLSAEPLTLSASLAGAGDHITPPDQVFALADYATTAPADVLRDTTAGGHLGLFMGHEALHRHWPPLLAAVRARSG